MKTREYKGFNIAVDFQATSQRPGNCHSVAGKVSKGATLQEVLAYENNAVVYRIAKEMGVTMEKARELFEDLKKFLWATSQATANTLPPPLIDEAWHAFVLFTQDYAEFCAKFFGGFIHHIPHRPEDAIIGPEDTKPSIDLFVSIFGERPSENWDYLNFKKAA